MAILDFAPCTPSAESERSVNQTTHAVAGCRGRPLPDLSNGGAQIIGQNDFRNPFSQTWGGSLQFTDSLQCPA